MEEIIKRDGTLMVVAYRDCEPPRPIEGYAEWAMTVQIDLQRLIREVGYKAIRGKTRVQRRIGGAIIVRAVKEIRRVDRDGRPIEAGPVANEKPTVDQLSRERVGPDPTKVGKAGESDPDRGDEGRA